MTGTPTAGECVTLPSGSLVFGEASRAATASLGVSDPAERVGGDGRVDARPAGRAGEGHAGLREGIGVEVGDRAVEHAVDVPPHGVRRVGAECGRSAPDLQPGPALAGKVRVRPGLRRYHR